MPWMKMTCGECGHTADIDKWTKTPVAGDLPRNTYQCPACKYAFERRQAKPTVYPNGFVMPGAISLVRVAAVL